MGEQAALYTNWMADSALSGQGYQQNAALSSQNAWQSAWLNDQQWQNQVAGTGLNPYYEGETGAYMKERDAERLAALRAGRLPAAMREEMERGARDRQRQIAESLGGQRGMEEGTMANTLLADRTAREDQTAQAKAFEEWRGQEAGVLEERARRAEGGSRGLDWFMEQMQGQQAQNAAGMREWWDILMARADQASAQEQANWERMFDENARQFNRTQGEAERKAAAEEEERAALSRFFLPKGYLSKWDWAGDMFDYRARQGR
mgnify:CR=1 FL=1